MDKIFNIPDGQKVAFHFAPLEPTKWSLDKVTKILRTYPHHAGHIVAYERDATREHYQGYFLLSEKPRTKDLKDLREWIRKEFNPYKEQGVSCVTCRNERHYKKYLLKEGHWISCGVDATELERFQLISYPKKKQFMDEVDDLEIRYLEKNLSDEQYIFEFMKLKGKYRQVINLNYVKQRLLMLIARSDDNRLGSIARHLADEVRNFG